MNPDPADGQYRLWAAQPGGFSTHEISPIRHNFDKHPLMQLPRLAELAQRLYPTKQCRFILPGAGQAAEFLHKETSFDGKSIEEVFSRIEEPGSWIALYNIETDAAYKEFLGEVVEAARPLIEEEQSEIHNVQGFLFISAPPSFTPFHIDRENNLWLQISGRKVMSVWSNRDRDVVAAVDVENFIFSGTLRNVKLTPEKRSRAKDFDVVAGTGVYFPTTSPHMTSTEAPESTATSRVSVSVGVVFYTAQTRRTANAHIMNLCLRRLGWRPTYAGTSAVMDRLKYPLARIVVWALRKFRGFEPKPGVVPES